MDIKINRYGFFPYVVLMTITTDDNEFETDVADLYGIVSESLIQQLREVADELEQHNAQAISKNNSPKAKK